jgi:FkbM family methyltransferase
MTDTYIMSNDDQILNRCFEKHSFQDLNSYDSEMLRNMICRTIELFPDSVDGVFFDVGCNAGSFVKALQTLRIRDNIHCFEPHPVLAQKTLETYPHIRMQKICIGSYDGKIDINIPMHSVGLSSIVNRPVFQQLGQPIKVLSTTCKTIDTYCEENKIDTIDFLKIDVEGAEKHVLMGAKRMLANHKIKAGVFEVGQTLIDAGTSGDELAKIIEFFGYKIEKRYSSNDYMFHL